MKILYRTLTAAEARHYREIRLESLKLHPESFGSTFAEQSQRPKLMFEAALEAEAPVDARFVMGAFEQKDLVGICGFIPLGSDNERGLSQAGEIIQMYVKPAYRGRKIGLGLVKAVMHKAFKKSEIEQIVLGVNQGNIGAIRVYEQAGFQLYEPEGDKAVNQVGFQMMVIRRKN